MNGWQALVEIAKVIADAVDVIGVCFVAIIVILALSGAEIERKH